MGLYVWSTLHGPTCDDSINRQVKGCDYMETMDQLFIRQMN